MAKFVKGESGNPKGRPAGTPNRSTAKFKEAVELVFAGLGGVKAMLAWAEKNKDDFYRVIYPKLAPLQVTGPNEGPLLVERIERVIIRPPERPVAGLLATRTIEATAEEVEPAPSAGGKHWAN